MAGAPNLIKEDKAYNHANFVSASYVVAKSSTGKRRYDYRRYELPHVQGCGEKRHDSRCGILATLYRRNSIQIRYSDTVGNTHKDCTCDEQSSAVGKHERQIAKEEEYWRKVFESTSERYIHRGRNSDAKVIKIRQISKKMAKVNNSTIKTS